MTRGNVQIPASFALQMAVEYDALHDGRILDRLVQAVNKHGSHRITVDVRMIWDRDVQRTTAICQNCPAHWSMEKTGPAIGMYHSRLDYLRYELVPFFGAIMEEECGLAIKKALLAEYVTERLAEAGPLGVTPEELVSELIVDLEAPGGDVAMMIRQLKMETWIRYEAVCPPISMMEASPEPGDMIVPTTRMVEVLRLPPGHPMRDW